MLTFALAYAAAMFVMGAALARIDDERAPYFPAGVAALLFPPISVPMIWLGSKTTR